MSHHFVLEIVFPNYPFVLRKFLKTNPPTLISDKHMTENWRSNPVMRDWVFIETSK